MILALYIVFCVVTIPILFVRDRLIGIIYSLLFLYSAFAFFGYLYMPGLSESIRAYFGDEAGYTSLYFVFASMVLIFLANLFVYSSKKIIEVPIGFQTNYNTSKNFSLFAIALPYILILIFSYLLILNAGNLSWAEAQQENISIELAIFIAIFKMSVGFLIVIYACIREKCYQNYRHLIPSFVIYVFVFLIASFLLGNRTDPAALIVGILFLESSRQKIDFKLILKSIAAIALAIVLLSVIEFFRYENTYNVASLTERIVRNDYFAPAHMLFASVAYGFIDLQEVINSNLSNAMILQNYPYLQETVTDMFNEGVATRSAGYAFFVLAEGFIALGFLGMFYNAFIITFFVRLWNSLGCTDSRFVNLLIKTVLATMCINVVRTQSSQFIKIMYTYFLPVMIVAVIMLGLRIGLHRRPVRQDA
jgi:O-antigen polysaccharide polymerase Wzy